MKLGISIIFLLTFIFCASQDKFTKWETLNNGSKGLTMYYRFVQESDSITLEVKIMVFKGIKAIPVFVSQGKKISFITDNGNRIDLINKSNAISCIGCGAAGMTGSNAEGAKLHYHISHDDLEMISKSIVNSFELQTNDEIYKIDVKPKKKLEFSERAAELLN